MAEAVEEPLLERLAEVLRQQRLVAVLGEQLARRAVELVAGRAAAHAGDRLVERLLDEPVVLDELLGRLAHAVRARHVGVAAGLAVLGPEVDDDRLAGRDRPGAHVVADGALAAVGDDQLVGRHVVGREHLADLLLDALARERLAVEHQHVTARVGRAQETARHVHRRLGRPLRAADALQLGLVLHPPAPRERFAVDGQLETRPPRRWSASSTGKPGGTTALSTPSERHARSATWR